MTAEFDLRRFFQRAPKDWLRQFCERHGALQDFDWTILTPRKINPLLRAWSALSEDIRTSLTAELRNIHILATPSGKQQMIDEALSHPEPEDIAPFLSELEDLHACAFWTYLERPKFWNGAVFFALADAKNRRYWRVRKNIPRLGRRPTKADSKKLASSLAKLFKDLEARGGECVVHPYRRGDLDYYFAYPKDHRQTTLEYEGGNVNRRPFNPAFEIIFIHDDKQQTLKIWHLGTMDRVRDLQIVFVHAVIGDLIEKNSPKDTRVYDLAPLMGHDFTFKGLDELGIQSVELRKIGIQILGQNGCALTLKLDEETDGHTLHEMIEQALANVPFSRRRVTRVGLKVVFERDLSTGRTARRTFEVITPNSTTIKDDEYRDRIELLLAMNDIEPCAQKTSDKNAG